MPPPAAVPVLAAATALAHDELVLETGPRRWRVRHIPKAHDPGSLKVNVMVRSGERFHVDTVDLYVGPGQGRVPRRRGHRAAHRRASSSRPELGRVLLATEDAQAAADGQPETDGARGHRAPSASRRWRLLESPTSSTRWPRPSPRLGVVGERDSALVAWLTFTSRLSDRPLGAVLQSSSSAGKSTLADAALSLVPDEATVAYSAMTGQALYYLGETDLAHKVLAIAEEEGAARATYALKLLVSEGRLAIAAAGKDPVTGRLVTHTYEVTGPVALLMTTTAAELDDELANRLLVLAVDEGRRPDPCGPGRPARRRDARRAWSRAPSARRSSPPTSHAQRLLGPDRGGEPARARCSGSATAPPGTAGTTPSTSGSSGPWPWPTSTSVPATRCTVDGRDGHLHRGERQPTSRRPRRSAPTCSAPPSTSWPRPPVACSVATARLRRRARRDAVHQTGAARGDRAWATPS